MTLLNVCTVQDGMDKIIDQEFEALHKGKPFLNFVSKLLTLEVDFLQTLPI
jgi:hypothetical protein